MGVAMKGLLSQRQRDAIRHFSYHGSDSSLIYKFILSPMAQFMVDHFVPAWMAPNLITTIGLMFNIVAALLVAHFNPTLSATNPHVGWLALISAICMFLYQTFDNMDGKQARKTGSASPLGLLFDHGCDAINAGISFIPVGSALGLGWGRGMFFCMIPLIPFYVQTWELFYVKAMVLPIINGPSEGLIVAITMMLMTYCTGSASWFHTSYTVMGRSAVPYNVMTSLALFGAVATFSIQAQNVMRKLHRDYKGKKGYGIYKGIYKAFSNLVPFIAFFASVCVWCTASGSLALTPKFRWWSLLLVSSVFVEIVSHINLMHITMELELQPSKRYVVLTTVCLAVVTSELFRRQVPYAAYMGEEALLIPFALASAYATLRFLHRMNTEVADCLNLHVFLMGPRVEVQQRPGLVTRGGGSPRKNRVE